MELLQLQNPTHTDQYLHFKSNRPIDHKQCMEHTLTHWAKSIKLNTKDTKDDKKAIQTSLRINEYSILDECAKI